MQVICSVIYRTLRFFFFNDTATTEIYTLSLHDALPIYTVCQSLNTANQILQIKYMYHLTRVTKTYKIRNLLLLYHFIRFHSIQRAFHRHHGNICIFFMKLSQAFLGNKVFVSKVNIHNFCSLCICILYAVDYPGPVPAIISILCATQQTNSDVINQSIAQRRILQENTMKYFSPKNIKTVLENQLLIFHSLF